MANRFRSLEEFITTQIQSLDQLRVLLLCRKYPEANWDADEVGCRLKLPPGRAPATLAELAAKRLLAASGNSGCYRYQPQSIELMRLVDQLAELDRVRPVTLVNMIAPLLGNASPRTPVSNSP